MEKWLLQRLNTAAAGVNSCLENRDFAEATNYAYRFFLNDFCDVFIEATKPTFESTEDTPEKLQVQNTLYTALEGGLKLLHPFMPYVTEDLWQRLPRRAGDETPSIMVAAFPEEVPEYNFPEAEADFDLTNDVIKYARTIVGLYNLPTNGKTPEDKITVIVQAKKAETKAMLESQAAIIVALTKGAGQAVFITEDSEVPAGCGTETVTADVHVHIPVEGKVDAAAEIAKLEKKQALTQTNRDKLVKVTKQANYETKIPAEVRADNVDKLEKFEAEIEAIRLGIERFKVLL